MTVGELLDGWTSKAVPTRVQNANTVTNYQRAAEMARKDLGSVRIALLTPDHVEKLYEQLAANGYSRATIVRVRSVLSQALTWGVRRRYAAWNPVAVAALPPDSQIGGRTRDGRSLTADEARAFIAATTGVPNGAGLVLALTCGLRPGEWTALTWADLDGDIVHIRRAWKDTDKNRRLGEPKTRKSARSVGVPSAVVAMLHEHRRAQLEESVALGWRNPNELMFLSEVGTPLDPANVRRLVRGVAKDAGITWSVTPYTLRHSAASLLVDLGVTIERVADLLGHASTQVTERYYTHPGANQCRRSGRAYGRPPGSRVLMEAVMPMQSALGCLAQAVCLPNDTQRPDRVAGDTAVRARELRKRWWG